MEYTETCMNLIKTKIYKYKHMASHVLSGKESTCQSGDVGFIPGAGRSLGVGNGVRNEKSCEHRSLVVYRLQGHKELWDNLPTKQQWHKHIYIYTYVYIYMLWCCLYKVQNWAKLYCLEHINRHCHIKNKQENITEEANFVRKENVIILKK